MISTSTAFQAAVNGSYQYAVRAGLLKIALSTTGLISNSQVTALQVIDGSVTLDSTAQIRATLDLTIAAGWPSTFLNPGFVPSIAGSEIVVSRGVTYGNGNVERCQLGIFRIDTIEESSRGTLRITGYDRSKMVADAKLLTPAQYSASFWTNGTAVNDLVGPILGQLVTWDSSLSANFLANLPRDMQEPSDRLGLINAIVAQQGGYFWVDNQGVARVSAIPNYTTLSPVWSATAKVTRHTPGTLISTDRRISRQDCANICVVQGQGLDGTSPVTGFAYDANPNSITFAGGLFGQLPVFLSTSLTDQASVNALAITTLSQYVGLPMSVDFTSLVNPALEPNDAVSVTTLPDPYSNPVGTGDTQTHVLTGVQIPLGPTSAMQARTRLQGTATLINGNPG